MQMPMTFRHTGIDDSGENRQLIDEGARINNRPQASLRVLTYKDFALARMIG